MEAGKKTSQTRLKLSHHGLLDSPNPFALTSERPNGFFVLLMRAGLLLCLVGSIILAFHSTLSTQTRRFRLPVHDQEKPPDDISPTNITHIQFGIGGSVRTWPERSSYGELWWVDNSTRGFVWLDKEPGANKTGRIPYRVSEDWTRFRYSSSQAAVRIARIVLESFRVGLPKVRWFVMGDDDTVFFTDNLVTVLASYDHNQMYYIGGNSESIEQDAIHAYGMAFGGGGFAISYALAAQLVDRFDGCLDRYWSFYGSDQRVWACVSELGVPLTKELGFHQLDIRGSPYGILAAHPIAPLVSLHHLDYLKPIFPNQTRLDSLKSLMNAYRVDPSRTLQQSFCHDQKRKWTVSVAWGYSVQIYPSLVHAKDLQTPMRTFMTWRSSADGPFTFNTRPVNSDLCQRPVVYMLDRAEELGRSAGCRTVYTRSVEDEVCGNEDYSRVMAVRRVTVSALKLDPNQYWKKALRRHCCEVMDRVSTKDGNMHIRIKKCRRRKTITF